jgi:hypothetical protein
MAPAFYILRRKFRISAEVQPQINTLLQCATTSQLDARGGTGSPGRGGYMRQGIIEMVSMDDRVIHVIRLQQRRDFTL